MDTIDLKDLIHVHVATKGKRALRRKKNLEFDK